jgi:hypothetical protein
MGCALSEPLHAVHASPRALISRPDHDADRDSTVRKEIECDSALVWRWRPYSAVEILMTALIQDLASGHSHTEVLITRFGKSCDGAER